MRGLSTNPPVFSFHYWEDVLDSVYSGNNPSGAESLLKGGSIFS